MADLEKQGVQISVDGVDKYVADLDKGNVATQKSQKTIADFSKSASSSLSGIGDGAGFDKIISGISGVASSGQGLTGIFASIGSAGGAAGAAIAAGMAGAVAAISGIIAVAGTASIAIAGIGEAINQAVSLGGQLSKIQNATGANASTTGGIFAAAKISGTNIDTVTGSLQALEQRVGNLGAKSTASFGAMSDATDKAGKAIGRLNDDYDRTIGEIASSATDRIAESNKNLAASYADMLAKQGESEANFVRDRDAGRAASAQRILDIETSTAASIAKLNEQASRLTEDNGRAVEKAASELARSLDKIESDRARSSDNIEKDLNQNIADRQSNLAKKVASLSDNAIGQREAATSRGAKAQSAIEENLQKDLVSIQKKYDSQRQSLQEKIYDPSTNPILRAYYKTQIGTLDKLQTAEEQSAKSGASAKADAAKRETADLIAEIQTRLDKEKALEEAAAAEDIARRKSDAAERTAELNRSAAEQAAERQRSADETATERKRAFAQASADLQTQIANENAQRDTQVAKERASAATREGDLQRSFDKQTATSQAAYDKQVAQAADAQLKIQAETQKRLDAEKRQYDRQLEDINASLQQALTGGAAGAAAAAIDPFTKALGTMNITAKEFAALPIDKKIELIGSTVQRLISEGNLPGAIELLDELFGPGQGAKIVDFFRKVGDAQGGVFTQKNIDDIKKYNESLGYVDSAVSDLVATIGIEFLPIAQEFLDWAIAFWKEHGPEITAKLKDVAKAITETVIPAVRDIKDWFVKFLGSITDTYKYIKGSLEVAFGTLATAATAVWDKLEPVRKLVENLGKLAFAGLTLNLGLASVAFDVLTKAASDVYNFLDKYLGPGIATIKQFGIDVLTTSIGLLEKGFDGVLSVIGYVATAIGTLATNISNFKLPAVLTPGSPTPFENGLRGIADAMDEVNKVGLPKFSMSSDITHRMANATASISALPSYMPATSSQIGASYSTSTASTNTSSASVTQNFYGKVDPAQVGDATANALYKQGFTVNR